MKTAGMVLGIIGGALGFICALFMLMGGYAFTNFPSNPEGTKQAATVFFAWGSIVLAGSAMGLAGGLLIKKKSVLSGVFMLVAAFLTLFPFFITFILLLLGGIFALVPERRPVMYGQAPPPYYQQPQYYPQQYGQPQQYYMPQQQYPPQQPYDQPPQQQEPPKGPEDNV